MARKRKYDDAVNDFFEDLMSDKIKKLRAAAVWDVHNGPLDSAMARDMFKLRSWPGYSAAVNELRKWWGEHGGDVWIDTQTDDVFDTDPEFWDRDEEDGLPELEDFMHYSDREAKLAVFGVLVTDGGM